ncbi:MAG: N-acetylmuramoyl-L-alanine amidase [Candidatus Peribacteria bacterium]|jgi:hypothetical protein|nr:N-acetylmuramoyl-L-alanine amidase [Candidatus Peribacteria bacterium]
MRKCCFFLFVFALVAPQTPTFAKDWEIPGINLITRAEWGADESMRFRENHPTTPSVTKPQTAAEKAAAEKAAKEAAERTAFMKKNFLNDWSYSSTKADLSGHKLLYPDQIQHHKTKIVIHHTATTYDTNWNTEEIKVAIQQIYKYHTLNRDFGDIGYNFLIDHLGNIYEGRAGGEGAVGMHVSYNNVATLGISLLGDFEKTQPTQAQINALTDLLTALTQKYQIDPTAYESYFQLSTTSPYISVLTLPSIVGHKDIAATACP